MISRIKDEIIVSVEDKRIIGVEGLKILNDGTLKINVITEEANARPEYKNQIIKIDSIFYLVKASKLSANDMFMRYKPCTEREEVFKRQLCKVIGKGIKDFYHPIIDPSEKDDGTGIEFVPGKKPAVGHSYNWWIEAAKAFDPKRGSRLATKQEYIAFLGVLIKELIRNGWKVEEAWHAVCNDSKELGHYKNSINAKSALEATGSRKICNFYDLANTDKMLAKYGRAGGNHCKSSTDAPLANIRYIKDRFMFEYSSVGFIILEK